MEQKKKITHLGGQPGQNRAEVIEEELSAKSEVANHVTSLIQQAGSHYKPDGFEMNGYALVFYYSKEFLGNPTFVHACQIHVNDVNEGAAGLGLQTLRQNLMSAFGHDQETRK